MQSHEEMIKTVNYNEAKVNYDNDSRIICDLEREASMRKIVKYNAIVHFRENKREDVVSIVSNERVTNWKNFSTKQANPKERRWDEMMISWPNSIP